MFNLTRFALAAAFGLTSLGCGGGVQTSNLSPAAEDHPEKLKKAVARAAELDAKTKEDERKALRGLKVETEE